MRTFTTMKSLSNRYALGELYEAVFPTARIEVSGQDFDKMTQMRFSARLQHAGFEKFKTGGLSVWRLEAGAVEQIKIEIVDTCPALPGVSALVKTKAGAARPAPAPGQIH